MSIEAMAWARKLTVGSATQKFVLWVLADYADESGNCWPSIARIERETQMARRTIFRALSELEDAGLIDKKKRFNENGKQQTTCFQLNMHAKATRMPAANDKEGCHTVTPGVSHSHPQGCHSGTIGVSHSHPQGCHSGTIGVPHRHYRGATVTPKPSIEPPIEPKDIKTRECSPEIENQFDQFWRAFPRGRKTDKPKALKLFTAIVTGKHKDLPQADAGVLIAAAVSYAATKPDPKFTPMPTTWLNGARWQDDLQELAYSEPSRKRMARY